MVVIKLSNNYNQKHVVDVLNVSYEIGKGYRQYTWKQTVNAYEYYKKPSGESLIPLIKN